MKRNLTGLVASLAVVIVTACGSTNAASNDTSPSPIQASSLPSASASAVATTTDPCQVVTAAEASQLASTSYGPGKEEAASSGDAKLCWYGAQTTNVFEVEVATASSASAAQTFWDTEKAKVQADLQKAVNVPGITVNINISDTSLSGADRAAVGTLNESYGSHTISAAAIYLLKGAVFLAIVDLTVDHPAPTSSAMEAQGQTSLGRLP